MLVRYTLVDSVTKKSVIDEPSENGPIDPAIEGLAFEFALTSQYPTSTPIHYGSCSDAANADASGVLAVVSQSEFDAAYQQELADRAAILRSQIDAERDRRISGGVIFNGKLFQTRVDDRENIAGVFSEAMLAVIGGAVAGDLRWRTDDHDFAWIAQDNTMVAMDAQTMIEFGKAVSAHKERHIFAAHALKNTNPLPSDFYNGIHWP